MPAVSPVLSRALLSAHPAGGACLFAFLSGIPTGLRVETGYLLSIFTAFCSPVQESASHGCFGMGRGVGTLLLSSGTHPSLLGFVSDLLERQSLRLIVCTSQHTLPHAGHGWGVGRWGGEVGWGVACSQ